MHAASLDDLATAPEGPATAVIDVLGLDHQTRTGLTLNGGKNARPENGIEAVFLELNRSLFSDKTVSDIKKTLLRAS